MTLSYRVETSFGEVSVVQPQFGLSGACQLQCVGIPIKADHLTIRSNTVDSHEWHCSEPATDIKHAHTRTVVGPVEQQGSHPVNGVHYRAGFSIALAFEIQTGGRCGLPVPESR